MGTTIEAVGRPEVLPSATLELTPAEIELLSAMAQVGMGASKWRGCRERFVKVANCVTHQVQ